MLEVRCDVPTVSNDLVASAAVGPASFIKSRVNKIIQQEIFKLFMPPSADQLYGDAGFVPVHSDKTTGNWFTDHGVTVPDRLVNWPDLNPIQTL